MQIGDTTIVRNLPVDYAPFAGLSYPGFVTAINRVENLVSVAHPKGTEWASPEQLTRRERRMDCESWAGIVWLHLHRLGAILDVWQSCKNGELHIAVEYDGKQTVWLNGVYKPQLAGGVHRVVDEYMDRAYGLHIAQEFDGLLKVMNLRCDIYPLSAAVFGGHYGMIYHRA